MPIFLETTRNQGNAVMIKSVLPKAEQNLKTDSMNFHRVFISNSALSVS